MEQAKNIKDSYLNLGLTPNINTPFTVMDSSYFENINDIIGNNIFKEQLSKDNVYAVPVTYFQDFKISINNITPKLNISYIKPIKYATAACLALALAVGMLFVPSKKTTTLTNAEIAQNINAMDVNTIAEYATLNYTTTPLESQNYLSDDELINLIEN